MLNIGVFTKSKMWSIWDSRQIPKNNVWATVRNVHRKSIHLRQPSDSKKQCVRNCQERTQKIRNTLRVATS